VIAIVLQKDSNQDCIGANLTLQHSSMSALFDFRSFICVLLLTICTCTFVKLKGEDGLEWERNAVAVAVVDSVMNDLLSNGVGSNSRGWNICYGCFPDELIHLYIFKERTGMKDMTDRVKVDVDEHVCSCSS